VSSSTNARLGHWISGVTDVASNANTLLGVLEELVSYLGGALTASSLQLGFVMDHIRHCHRTSSKDVSRTDFDRAKRAAKEAAGYCKQI